MNITMRRNEALQKDLRYLKSPTDVELFGIIRGNSFVGRVLYFSSCTVDFITGFLQQQTSICREGIGFPGFS